MAVDSFERVPRLDPVRAVDVIADATGVRLTLEGRPRGGEVGAAYVRWSDEHRSVLTMGSARVASLIDLARTVGVAAPRYELAVPDGDLTYLVQTLLPGAPPTTVDKALVEQMIEINSRLVGLLRNRADLPVPSLFLRTGGPGFCLHEPLARYDRRTAEVLAWVRDVGADGDMADGDDLMHLDFHPGNVLVDAGALSGVVDWDGAARGDGRLDLVTLRFYLALHAHESLARLKSLRGTSGRCRYRLRQVCSQRSGDLAYGGELLGGEGFDEQLPDGPQVRDCGSV